MASLRYVELGERGVIALSGPETRPFLQGLISNDVERVTPEQASYAALLTPQGKFLFDFLVFQHGDALLLDAERARIPDLVRRLMMYRLRSKVQIEDVSERYAVAALIGDGAAGALGLPERPGAVRALDAGVVGMDPRLAALGGRALLPPDALHSTLERLGFARGERDDYEHHRLTLGVPDGSRDLVVEKSTLLESGFEELNGVDFKKGCFVGQELTARMKYRGLVKRRLVPVAFEGPTPESGTQVVLDGKDAGEMRSSADGIGLALLRLEQISKAETAGSALRAGDSTVTPKKPAWVNF